MKRCRIKKIKGSHKWHDSSTSRNSRAVLKQNLTLPTWLFQLCWWCITVRHAYLTSPWMFTAWPMSLQGKSELPCERWRSEWHRSGGAKWWQHHTHTLPSPLPAHLMTRSPPPSPWADWATLPHSWLEWSSWWKIQNNFLINKGTFSLQPEEIYMQ